MASFLEEAKKEEEEIKKEEDKKLPTITIAIVSHGEDLINQKLALDSNVRIYSRAGQTLCFGVIGRDPLRFVNGLYFSEERILEYIHLKFRRTKKSPIFHGDSFIIIIYYCYYFNAAKSAFFLWKSADFLLKTSCFAASDFLGSILMIPSSSTLFAKCPAASFLTPLSFNPETTPILFFLSSGVLRS